MSGLKRGTDGPANAAGQHEAALSGEDQREVKRMKLLQFVSSVSLIALIFLCLAWELWLAPLRPGGSGLVMKTLPLLLPLMGILKGRRYTYQWAPMLMLVYFTEGAVRAWSDKGLSAGLAVAEVVLALVFFFAAIYYAKFSAPSRHAQSGSR
jgi:uncharacterized membrane protein